MISGPIIPRTGECLWELLNQDPSLIERGLQVVRGDLVLDEGLVIDALARDASGGPVLLFCAADTGAGFEERRLPGRIREACDWFVRNWRVLATALPDCAIRLNDPPRLIAVGFEFSDVCLERLRDPEFAELSVYRFEGVFIDGQRHIGVTPVFGKAIEEMTSSAVPVGIRDVDLGARCGQFLEIMARLDPDLRIEGDRFSRRFFSSAGFLAELRYDGDSLLIATASDEARIVQTEEDIEDVVDRVLRCYLEGRLGVEEHAAANEGIRNAEGRNAEGRNAEGSGHRETSAICDRSLQTGKRSCEGHGIEERDEEEVPAVSRRVEQADSPEAESSGRMGSTEGRLTLGGLRERMAQAQVSSEELEAFCELETRGDGE